MLGLATRQRTCGGQVQQIAGGGGPSGTWACLRREAIRNEGGEGWSANPPYGEEKNGSIRGSGDKFRFLQNQL